MGVPATSLDSFLYFIRRFWNQIFTCNRVSACVGLTRSTIGLLKLEWSRHEHWMEATSWTEAGQVHNRRDFQPRPTAGTVSECGRQRLPLMKASEQARFESARVGVELRGALSTIDVRLTCLSVRSRRQARLRRSLRDR